MRSRRRFHVCEEEVQVLEGELGTLYRLRRPLDSICPECRREKPEDERVLVGMKCSACAGYG